MDHNFRGIFLYKLGVNSTKTPMPYPSSHCHNSSISLHIVRYIRAIHLRISAFGLSNNNMAMVDVGHVAAIQADSTPKSVSLVGGSADARRADLHSSR